MKITYKVFKKAGERVPVLSLIDIPRFQLRGKKKFVGKKAKIEAIYRFSGVQLPDSYTTDQVNNYIAQKLFKTSDWVKYHSTYKEVRREVDTVSDTFEFLYNLEVELSQNVSVDDERIVMLATSELMGKSLSEFKGLKNIIVSLKKQYL